MHKYFASFLLIIGLLFTQKGSLEAWNETGHMVVAEIAKQHLNRDAKIEVERLSNYFTAAYPESSTLTTAATWADDLRDHGIDAFSHWHYTVKPYDPEQFLSQNELTRITAKQKDNDIQWALKQSINTLRNPKATDFEKAFMLRFVLHLMGDIHQPMHCTTMFSKKFPEGDHGGNLFKIKVPEKNLHKYWDSGAGLFQLVKRPLDDRGEAYIRQLAQDAIETCPYDQAQENLEIRIPSWAQESYALAILISYQIPQDSEPTEEYVAKARQLAKERVALAGYRLAYLLNHIFDQ